MKTLADLAMTTPTRQRPERPTKNYSRHFDVPENQNSVDKRQLISDAEDCFSRGLKSYRSTSYTSPLPLGDRSGQSKKSAPLTKDNLQALLRGLESQKSAPPSLDSGSARHGEQGPMRKTKSPKKSTSRKSKPDPDSHPLNLPPDKVRRLSAAMAKDEARNATPMDLDDSPMTNGDSQPATPAQEAPGAFPDEHTNGVNGEDAKSPTPPPHKPQQVDPEACKAAGNKYFKAKDYDRAVQEYSKGKQAHPQT